MIRGSNLSDSEFYDDDSSSALNNDADLVSPIIKLKRYLASTSSRLDRLIRVKVSDEGVELTGEVYSRGDRVLAESIARAVLPNYPVRNQIVFVRPSRISKYMKIWR
jgi:osmotically-inducible protein OsmY